MIFLTFGIYGISFLITAIFLLNMVYQEMKTQPTTVKDLAFAFVMLLVAAIPFLNTMIAAILFCEYGQPILDDVLDWIAQRKFWDIQLWGPLKKD